MRNYFDTLYQNQDTIAYFRSAIEGGKLAHAYILEGPRGSGKRTLAKAICATRVQNSPFASKIESEQSPDLLFFGLQENKKTIGVDTVRALKSAVYVKPSELDAKFFILTDCQAMTVQAQNAALKILEEPPQNVYFFLCTDSVSALLPTVRSRAQTIRMQSFGIEELSRYARSIPKWAKLAESDPERFSELIISAGGCIGGLEGTGEDKETLSQKQSAKKLISLLDAGEYMPLLLYCHKLTTKRTELDKILLYTACGLRDALAAKYGQSDAQMLYPTQDAANDATRHLTTRAMLNAAFAIEKTREQLTCNPNLKGVQALLADTLLAAIQK